MWLTSVGTYQMFVCLNLFVLHFLCTSKDSDGKITHIATQGKKQRRTSESNNKCFRLLVLFQSEELTIIYTCICIFQMIFCLLFQREKNVNAYLNDIEILQMITK